jgi:Rod binding domain-containing protein
MSIDPTPRAAGAPAAFPETAAAAADPERLRALAAQFESLLLGQMVKEMRHSFLDEEDKASGFGDGPLAEAMYSELSLALSRAGGIGIAQSMMAPLAEQAGGGDPATQPAAVLPLDLPSSAAGVMTPALAVDVLSGRRSVDPTMLPLAVALGDK